MHVLGTTRERKYGPAVRSSRDGMVVPRGRRVRALVAFWGRVCAAGRVELTGPRCVCRCRVRLAGVGRQERVPGRADPLPALYDVCITRPLVKRSTRNPGSVSIVRQDRSLSCARWLLPKRAFDCRRCRAFVVR